MPKVSNRIYLLLSMIPNWSFFLAFAMPGCLFLLCFIYLFVWNIIIYVHSYSLIVVLVFPSMSLDMRMKRFMLDNENGGLESLDEECVISWSKTTHSLFSVFYANVLES